MNLLRWFRRPQANHRELVGYLRLLLATGRKLVTLNEDINAKLDRVETLSGEIAGDLDEVIEKLNNAPAEGLTKAEAEALAARLDGHVTALEGIAGKVPEPEPPVEG